MCALMSLVNLCHSNASAQQLLLDHRGIPVLLSLAQHPLYDVRKTAVFCIGNVVRGSEAPEASAGGDVAGRGRSAAEEVVAAGGIMVLISLLNDEEEDELSKRVWVMRKRRGPQHARSRTGAILPFA